MDTRTEGSFGGAVGLLPSPSAVRDPGDPASVATPSKTLRVVIAGPGTGGAGRPVPGARGPADDVTTRLPAIRDDGSRRRVPPARRDPGAGRERDGTATPAHGRRATLQGGTVLLPLRLFLGGAFLVEGLRKLYAPGFLDPGSTDSFGHRIGVLRDGSLSPSVMDLAADHAIGAGLLFAFGQVVVGFAVVLGLWTRLAGLLGMLLSLGVLIAVGTGSSPYHAPYVVFLAAFSPLALAGAPMYSADAWLSLRTWRGPIITPVRARRRKLGYGSMLACAGVGTTLLAGSLLGGGHRHLDESDTGRIVDREPATSTASTAPVAPEAAQHGDAVATQPRPPMTEPSAAAVPGRENAQPQSTPRPTTTPSPTTRTGSGEAKSASPEAGTEKKSARPSTPAAGSAGSTSSTAGSPGGARGPAGSAGRPLGGLLG
ncbi:TQO small subunit DoxD [Embleya scabrispora]|uniref:TQO small subunit DoxD n=1 Tax=Embleya scabrispora TaxID=159449 RepID=UPI0003A7761C|nr:DoxX family protein [Embleya scabrispora]MYS79882.1 DoxX family membrane protein [Streptomyces sp. SID5474]